MYLIISKVDGFIEEKNESKYLAFDSTDENEEVVKNIQNFAIGLKMRLRQWMVVKKVSMVKML